MVTANPKQRPTHLYSLQGIIHFSHSDDGQGKYSKNQVSSHLHPAQQLQSLLWSDIISHQYHRQEDDERYHFTAGEEGERELGFQIASPSQPGKFLSVKCQRWVLECYLVCMFKYATQLHNSEILYEFRPAFVPFGWYNVYGVYSILGIVNLIIMLITPVVSKLVIWKLRKSPHFLASCISSAKGFSQQNIFIIEIPVKMSFIPALRLSVDSDTFTLW